MVIDGRLLEVHIKDGVNAATDMPADVEPSAQVRQAIVAGDVRLQEATPQAPPDACRKGSDEPVKEIVDRRHGNTAIELSDGDVVGHLNHAQEVGDRDFRHDAHATPISDRKRSHDAAARDAPRPSRTWRRKLDIHARARSSITCPQLLAPVVWDLVDVERLVLRQRQPAVGHEMPRRTATASQANSPSGSASSKKSSSR